MKEDFELFFDVLFIMLNTLLFMFNLKDIIINEINFMNIFYFIVSVIMICCSVYMLIFDLKRYKE